MKTKVIFTLALLCAVSFTASAQIKLGGKKINLEKAAKAATDATKAITLTDEDIAVLSREYVQWMDTHNPLASPDSEYGKRLAKIIGGITSVEGMPVNFGVYEVVDVNAFACGDGSVRVCAGLMDLMTDDEVLAVIGHEIGHVVNTDSKDAIKSAYMRSAASNAVGAVNETAAKLSDSQLGALAESLAGAQYSQKQENAADDYGFKFTVERGVNPYAMHDSLNKLLALSEGAPKDSKFRALFSSHPETEKRVARMKEKADKYKAK